MTLSITTTLPALRVVLRKNPNHPHRVETRCDGCGGQVWECDNGMPFCSACGALDIAAIQAQALAMETVRARFIDRASLIQSIEIQHDMPDVWIVSIETDERNWEVTVTHGAGEAFTCEALRTDEDEED